MASRSNDVHIDHLVVLLSEEEFENPPPWLKENFHILDGGDHTFQNSRNKLVTFRDGTYLELFSWKGTPPPGNIWGERDNGILDFALSVAPPSTAATNHPELSDAFSTGNADADLGVKYGNLKPCGRKTLAGVEVKWETLHAEYFDGPKTPSDLIPRGGRLEAPFWCHDKTARNLRIPFDDVEKTTHPSGATGIAEVDILVAQDLFREYTELYQIVTGGVAEPVDDGSGANRIHLRSPASAAKTAQLSIHPPRNDAETAWLKKKGVGFAGFSLNVEGREGHSSENLSESGTGSRVSFVW